MVCDQLKTRMKRTTYWLDDCIILLRKRLVRDDVLFPISELTKEDGYFTNNLEKLLVFGEISTIDQSHKAKSGVWWPFQTSNRCYS